MVQEKITSDGFKKLIGRRSESLLSLAGYLSERNPEEEFWTRPLLGELLSQSMQLEELLDAYDARNNCEWCVYRSLTAAFKLFSDVSYELLHIKHALPAYHLLSIKEDFVEATRECLKFTGGILLLASNRMVEEAKSLGLSIPELNNRSFFGKEHLPSGRLPHDCKIKPKGTVSETVTLLSAAFLNLSADSGPVCSAGRARPEEYESYARGSVREESLRTLELRFHNLQSMYDTYVSGTELEGVDNDLVVLRGHISVVFHLLRTATAFVHYYERHLTKPLCEIKSQKEPLLHQGQLLGKLMGYSLTFMCRYLDCGKQLCQSMLHRYAEIDQIEVTVPPYRGFHVRPATLISKLVLHYGSAVTMKLEGDEYDASSSLDLFRANEKLNANKRRWLAEEILRLNLVPSESKDTDVRQVIRGVVMTLAERGKLILYEQPLEVPDKFREFEGTLLGRVTSGISQLLALGKIDISTGIKVTFVGDKRVLSDIKLLAENGYGEDNFGNNIALPKKLEYLRR